jgi:surface polysaccharide O-acyltransferase-like enzyme
MLLFPAFALGILFAKYEKWFLSLNFGLVAALFVFCLAFSLMQFDSWTISTFKNLPMLVVGCCAILIIVMKVEDELHIPKWIEFVSYSSLSVYMFHRVVYKVLIYVYFPDSGLFQIFYLFLICLPVTILVSGMIQRIYDMILSHVSIRAMRSENIYHADSHFH